MNPAVNFSNLAATDRSVAARMSSGLNQFVLLRSIAILRVLKHVNVCT